MTPEMVVWEVKIWWDEQVLASFCLLPRSPPYNFMTWRSNQLNSTQQTQLIWSSSNQTTTYEMTIVIWPRRHRRNEQHSQHRVAAWWVGEEKAQIWADDVWPSEMFELWGEMIVSLWQVADRVWYNGADTVSVSEWVEYSDGVSDVTQVTRSTRCNCS